MLSKLSEMKFTKQVFLNCGNNFMIVTRRDSDAEDLAIFIESCDLSDEEVLDIVSKSLEFRKDSYGEEEI